jgi:hypothetical protein
MNHCLYYLLINRDFAAKAGAAQITSKNTKCLPKKSVPRVVLSSKTM